MLLDPDGNTIYRTTTYTYDLARRLVEERQETMPTEPTLLSRHDGHFISIAIDGVRSITDTDGHGGIIFISSNGNQIIHHNHGLYIWTAEDWRRIGDVVETDTFNTQYILDAGTYHIEILRGCPWHFFCGGIAPIITVSSHANHNLIFTEQWTNTTPGVITSFNMFATPHSSHFQYTWAQNPWIRRDITDPEECDNLHEPRNNTPNLTTTTYTFDNRSNRSTMAKTTIEQDGETTTQTTTYTYDANNRLLTSTKTTTTTGHPGPDLGYQTQTTTYTYDPNGNQLSQITTGSQGNNQSNNITNQTSTYNTLNQLIRVIDNNMTAIYTYRADGLRHTKTIASHQTPNNPATPTIHIWNTTHIVLELRIHHTTNTTVVANRFLRGIGGHLIRSDHHGFYLFNVRGDVVQRVDNQGNIMHTYMYDGFGNQKNQDPQNTNPFRFAGEYYDWETSTIYLRARVFNPRTGRFTQPDPHWGIHNMVFGDSPIVLNESPIPNPLAIMQSANLFTYCMNNPVMFIDPSGKFVISTAALLAIIGALTMGTTGGIIGNHIANQHGATGWDRARYIAWGVGIGGTIGAIGGYYIAPFVVAATGITGISITSSGIVTLTSQAAIWALPALERGKILHQKLGSNLPHNFPVIDRVVQGPGDVARSITSIKSIDLSARTYNLGNNLFGRIMRYANQLNSFQGRDNWAGHTVHVNNSTQRILEIAIPHGATSAQMQQIQRAVEAAAKFGVEIRPIIFR